MSTRLLDLATFLDCPTYLGVATAWIDEDGDAIAITTDLRRGLAAIHAQARYDLGGPASLTGVTQRWVRFEYPPNCDEWLMRGCAATDTEAVPVVIAHEVAVRA